MDLNDLDTRAGSDQGFLLELLHPITREPLKAYITVLGKDGATFQQRHADIRRRRLDRIARGLNSAATVDVVEAEGIELTAACCQGWTGIKKGDADWPPGEANAIKLLTQYEWIREQVDAAIHNRANFLPGDATSSSHSPGTSSAST
jgi:hypothetical protein